jgi:hypothetical protein
MLAPRGCGVGSASCWPTTKRVSDTFVRLDTGGQRAHHGRFRGGRGVWAAPGSATPLFSVSPRLASCGRCVLVRRFVVLARGRAASPVPLRGRPSERCSVGRPALDRARARSGFDGADSLRVAPCTCAVRSAKPSRTRLLRAGGRSGPTIRTTHSRSLSSRSIARGVLKGSLAEPTYRLRPNRLLLVGAPGGARP